MQSQQPLLISRGTLTQNTLNGSVAVVTGSGGGIGYEAARALVWLGARVAIAEIDREKGSQAEAALQQEFMSYDVMFVQTDVASVRSVRRMARLVDKQLGPVDIIINNAAVTPLGAVLEAPMRDWDLSYRVNLRGPVLMARTFLPGMLKRRRGVFAAVSSTGGAYMGPYEIMKAAQVELADTLVSELEGSGIHFFSIGPGYVATEAGERGLREVARLSGQSFETLHRLVRPQELSVEAAGAGFAAAVALAERFHTQEIGSIQALRAAGIDYEPVSEPLESSPTLPQYDWEALRRALGAVQSTLLEQSGGWKERSIFERTWLRRTFRRYAGLPVERCLKSLERACELAASEDAAGLRRLELPLEGLLAFYKHLKASAQGFVKDHSEREEQTAIVQGWVDEVAELEGILN